MHTTLQCIYWYGANNGGEIRTITQNLLHYTSRLHLKFNCTGGSFFPASVHIKNVKDMEGNWEDMLLHLLSEGSALEQHSL